MQKNTLTQVNLVGIHEGSVGLLACPGPSLQAGYYGGYKRVVFALNTAWPTVVRPDIWVGPDKPECYHRAIWEMPFPKFTRMGLRDSQCQGRPLTTLPNTYFMADSPYGIDQFPVHAYTSFMWLQCGFWFPIQLALVMGIRSLFLAGCDFSNAKQDYCHEKRLDGIHRKRNQTLYDKILADLSPMADHLEKLGLTLYSATEDSPINEYLPFRHWWDIVKGLDRQMPHTLDEDFRHSQVVSPFKK